MKGEVKLTGTNGMCSANFCGVGSTIIGSISLLQIFITASHPVSHPFPLPDPVGAQSHPMSQPTSDKVMNVAHFVAPAQYFLQKNVSIISSVPH